MQTLINLDFARAEKHIWETICTTAERRAILARAFGAGEVKVALLLGRYPVPHDDLDKAERLLNRIPGGWSI